MLWHTAGTPREAWTVLAEDASAGDTEIKLQKPVDWQVGDHIAIASTGKRHSQRENEEREISAVSISLGVVFTMLNGHRCLLSIKFIIKWKCSML